MAKSMMTFSRSWGHLTPLHTGDPFGGTNLLAVSVGRDLGALEGVQEPPPVVPK